MGDGLAVTVPESVDKGRELELIGLICDVVLSSTILIGEVTITGFFSSASPPTVSSLMGTAAVVDRSTLINVGFPLVLNVFLVDVSNFLFFFDLSSPLMLSKKLCKSISPDPEDFLPSDSSFDESCEDGLLVGLKTAFSASLPSSTPASELVPIGFLLSVYLFSLTYSEL